MNFTPILRLWNANFEICAISASGELKGVLHLWALFFEDFVHFLKN